MKVIQLERIGLLLLLNGILLGASQTVVVNVDKSPYLQTVLSEYASVTFDWWTRTKPGWDMAGLHDINLDNPRLIQYAKRIAPAFLRLGGIRSDQQIFVENSNDIKASGCIVGSTCLNTTRLNQILGFACSKAGFRVVFSVNGLYGRKKVDDPWNSSNAEKLFKWITNSKYKTCVYGLQLGNELNDVGIISKGAVLARDFIFFKKVIAKYWNSSIGRPKLLGPSFSVATHKLAPDFLKSAKDVLDFHSYHFYSLADGLNPDLFKLYDSVWLNFMVKGLPDQVLKLNDANSPKVPLFVDESASAYNSGQNGTTNTFLNSLWYTVQLGVLAASRNHYAFCRQALVGGFYELVDKYSYEPNPDYYILLLWKQLMGNRVLNTANVTTGRPNSLYVYSHCSAMKKGFISLAIVNNDLKNAAKIKFNTNSKVSVRTDYTLSTGGATLRSRKMRLNGKILQTDKSGNLPDLVGNSMKMDQILTLAPRTIAFVHLPTTSSACA
jgi:heparanase 1